MTRNCQNVDDEGNATKTAGMRRALRLCKPEPLVIGFDRTTKKRNKVIKRPTSPLPAPQMLPHPNQNQSRWLIRCVKKCETKVLVCPAITILCNIREQYCKKETHTHSFMCMLHQSWWRRRPWWWHVRKHYFFINQLRIVVGVTWEEGRWSFISQ